MKINEAILLESFGDLKRFIDQYFISIFGTTEPKPADWIAIKDSQSALYRDANDLATLKTRLKQYLPDFPDANPITSKRMLEVIRFIIKDDRVRKQDQFKDTGVWIKTFKAASSPQRSGGVGPAFMIYSLLQTIYSDTIRYLIENPPRQKPQIKEIAKTPHYHIFELENFEAAVKVKNTFGVRWCIGVEEGWFRRYGEDMGRKTYVVSLPNKKVFAVHSGDSLLITTHDNDSEVNDNGTGRGEGMRAVVKQMKEAGFDNDLIPDIIISFLKKIKAPYTSSFVKEIEKNINAREPLTIRDLSVVVNPRTMSPSETHLRMFIVNDTTGQRSDIMFSVGTNERGYSYVINDKGNNVYTENGSTFTIFSTVSVMLERIGIEDIQDRDNLIGDVLNEIIQDLTSIYRAFPNFPPIYREMFGNAHRTWA